MVIYVTCIDLSSTSNPLEEFWCFCDGVNDTSSYEVILKRLFLIKKGYFQLKKSYFLRNTDVI